MLLSQSNLIPVYVLGFLLPLMHVSCFFFLFSALEDNILISNLVWASEALIVIKRF